MAWLLMPTHPAAMAQERHTAIITAQYKVNGVCEQCKKRIEDATYIKGVKHADWSIDTHILTLRYDTTKTSADVILKAVADAGHDNEKYTAPDDAYQAIPKCCRYRDKVPPHMN
jgi:copper chaperone CopZ